MPKYTLLILTHNRLDAVQACFDSLAPTLAREDVRCLVYDNASDDGTTEWLTDADVTHTYRHLWPFYGKRNMGVAGGRAELLRWASYGVREYQPEAIPAEMPEYLVFLDSDTIVSGDWLDRHGAILDTMPNVGMVGVGGSMVLPDWSGFIAAQSPDSEVDCLSGYCQMFRRELLDYGLHLDTDAYPNFWAEDSDFCLQIRALGYDIWCVRANVMHNPAHSGYGQDMTLHDAHLATLRARWQGKGLVKCEGAY